MAIYGASGFFCCLTKSLLFMQKFHDVYVDLIVGLDLDTNDKD